MTASYSVQRQKGSCQRGKRQQQQRLIACAAFSASPDRFPENVLVFPVVIPELELSNIERKVFAAHLVVGADDTPLQDRPEALNRIRVDRTDDVLTPGVIDGPVGELLGRQSAIGRPIIVGNETDLGRNGLAHELHDGAGVGLVNDLGDHTALTLYSADDGSFALGAAATYITSIMRPVAITALTADIGLIDFHHADQLAELFVGEPGPDPVAHVPSGFVAAEAHRPMHLEGRNTLLGGQHHVDHAKPVPERLIRVFEDGPGDVGEPITAVGGAAVALPLVGHRGDRVRHDHAAARAPDFGRPTVLNQVIGARIFGGEGRFPLGDGHLVNALFSSHVGSPGLDNRKVA